MGGWRQRVKLEDGLKLDLKSATQAGARSAGPMPLWRHRLVLQVYGRKHRIRLAQDRILWRRRIGAFAVGRTGKTSMLTSLPTKVVGELVEPDLYGHPETHPMFSFTFTSEMASKIDWEGFDAKSFQTIAPDFHYSPWFDRNYRSQPPE
jgi:hypothetical protein